MAYRALYRQWRPAAFSQVIGQKAIIDTLRNQVITQRIAHAYLFCGSRGTGKTSTAKILAKAINCENPENGDPCGKCENCIRVQNEESLDIIEIDAASNNGVDEIRDLRETVKYPPQYGRYKVYIIDEVHMLSSSAFNALLKTLEEPPAHIVFILATTEPQKLPATILSRCQRFDFGRISSADICNRLREAAESSGADFTEDALMHIARAAEGGMRDALSILDMCIGYGKPITDELVQNVLGTNDQAFLFRFAEAIEQENASECFKMINQLMRNGRDPAVFAHEFAAHIRALLITACCGKEASGLLETTDENIQEYKHQSEGFTISRLMSILDLFLSLENNMRYASSPRLALENASLKCCIRTKETDARALSDRIDEIEKKLLNPNMFTPGHQTGSIPKKQQNKAAAVPISSESGQEAAERKTTSGNTPMEIWKKATDLIRKKEPAIIAMLSQGQFIRREGDLFIWQAKEAGSFFTTALNQKDRKEKISAFLSECCGESCRFQAVEPAAPEKQSTEKNEPDNLDPLMETFGREAVRIVETLNTIG